MPNSGMNCNGSEILVDVDGSVTTITFNRPDALNALTPTMLVALDQAVGIAIGVNRH